MSGVTSPPRAETDRQACPRCEGETYLTLFRASDRLYRTTEQRFHVVECSDCGLVRLHPRPDPAELARFYPQTYWWEADDSASGRLAEMYRRFVLGDHVRFVAASLDGLAPVLDVGCGGGSFLHALGKPAQATVGLDSSRTAASVAHANYQLPAVCGSVPSHPFRPGSFGAVTLFHVLEHVSDPRACLLAIRDALIAEGKLFLQVPNADCWQFLLLGSRWSGLDVPRHLIHFRAEDLEHLLANCGFEVVRRKFFSLRDNPAGLATSLCPQLEPVSRRVRRVKESNATRLLKDLLYLALVSAAVPFTLLEAASEAGSTITVEAVRRGEA